MVEILTKQRKYFNSNITKDIDFRKKMLKKLLLVIDKNEAEIYAALKADLNKSEYEAYLTEVQIVKTEIKTAIKKLKKWTKPEKVKTPITLFPSQSYIYHEPYGIALILSPWNYPFQLALSPLVGAIAAGNCAVLKTSKNSKKHLQSLKRLFVKPLMSSMYIV